MLCPKHSQMLCQKCLTSLFSHTNPMKLVWLNPIAVFQIFYLCSFHKVISTVLCKGKEISMYNHCNQELFDKENGGNANEKDKKALSYSFNQITPGSS